MRIISLAIPLVGLTVATSVPLVRYAMKDRNERAAIDVVRRVHDAQRAFHARTRGYASDISSLVRPCDGADASLPAGALEDLMGAGYVVGLRAAVGAEVTGTDCQGRPITSDYLVTAAPASPAATGRQAFAGRNDGRIYLFYDGIPPTERDIAEGLPTAVEDRASFKIP